MCFGISLCYGIWICIFWEFVNALSLGYTVDGSLRKNRNGRTLMVGTETPYKSFLSHVYELAKSAVK